MENNESSIIDRVKKLLRLGTSSNIHEAENAISAAHVLMQKHRISVAEIEMTTGVKQENIKIDQNAAYSSGRIPGWKFTLFDIIAKHCGCASFKDRIYRGDSNLHLVGRESDIEMSKYLFMYSMNELVRLSDQYCKGKGHIYYDSWFYGACAGIDRKLKEIEQGVYTNCTLTAIVLVNDRQKEADSFMRKEMKMVTSKSNHSNIDKTAFRVGMYVGNQDIDLSTKNKLKDE